MISYALGLFLNSIHSRTFKNHTGKNNLGSLYRWHGKTRTPLTIIYDKVVTWTHFLICHSIVIVRKILGNFVWGNCPSYRECRNNAKWHFYLPYFQPVYTSKVVGNLYGSSIPWVLQGRILTDRLVVFFTFSTFYVIIFVTFSTFYVIKFGVEEIFE